MLEQHFSTAEKALTLIIVFFTTYNFGTFCEYDQTNRKIYGYVAQDETITHMLIWKEVYLSTSKVKMSLLCPNTS